MPRMNIQETAFSLYRLGLLWPWITLRSWLQHRVELEAVQARADSLSRSLREWSQEVLRPPHGPLGYLQGRPRLVWSKLPLSVGATYMTSHEFDYLMTVVILTPQLNGKWGQGRELGSWFPRATTSHLSALQSPQKPFLPLRCLTSFQAPPVKPNFKKRSRN